MAQLSSPPLCVTTVFAASLVCMAWSFVPAYVESALPAIPEALQHILHERNLPCHVCDEPIVLLIWLFPFINSIADQSRCRLSKQKLHQC